MGGIDIDPLGCADFEYLTGTPELCSPVESLTVADVVRRFGPRAPDCVFMSPPCKGASGLLSEERSQTAKYARMNELALTWTRLMLAAWGDDPPPLVLLENVPRLKTRAAKMLKAIRKLLRGAGYVLTDAFHDCGELGGLAQRRRRYLLVARHPGKCPPVLYQPPAKRVRGCGEVLSQLPVPGTIEARAFGRMHELPKLSWLNWIRLSLIPAGGDWRDLEGVLAEGQARREQFKRHAVEDWAEPTGTVGGSGSNGVANVADPRIRVAFDAGYAVLRWEDPARTVAGGSAVGQGAYAVADIRVGSGPRAGAYGVLNWDEHAKTITGHLQHDNGAAAVADPRKPPPFVPVIIAADDTWHRPLSTLELAALQGFPLIVRGEPLKLAGTSHSKWRERIGNAVPAPAARAIAEKMLIALAESSLGTFSLSSDAVWVLPEAEARS
jgi:site-specific DNA-cytosine methylase